MRRPTLTIALVVCLLFVVILACSRAPVTDEGLPVTQVGGGVGGGAALQGGVTPNAGSLDVAPFPTVPVRGTPTPDPPRANALYPGGDYQVQPGDSLEAIAQRAGVTVADLVSANEGLDPAAGLSPAMVLHLPAPVVVGPDFKIIPNSELVYSPTTIGFDTINFVQSHGGYLAAYTEEVESRERTGAEIVEFVARQYSVNPRLLLALLEHQSGWVTQQNPDPATLYYPMGHASEPWKSGLDAQLRWAANQLNRGYYLWRAGSLATLTLADGSEVTLVPTLNAGTVGVEHFFAQHYGGAGWLQETGPGPTGFAATYRRLFGDPFGYTFDPVLPDGLVQPTLGWPFTPDEGWYYSGGPHGAWDTGSAWGALDFAPPDHDGCGPSPAWVRAAASGLIVRSDAGAVVQDLSGDGIEQTGWALFYMHLWPEERAVVGMFAKPGDPLGHPSCEGGFANARHLHIARKYNGEWIPADAGLPFVIDGWVSAGTGAEYDGYLFKGDQQLEACDCISDSNLIYFPP